MSTSTAWRNHRGLCNKLAGLLCKAWQLSKLCLAAWLVGAGKLWPRWAQAGAAWRREQQGWNYGMDASGGGAHHLRGLPWLTSCSSHKTFSVAKTASDLHHHVLPSPQWHAHALLDAGHIVRYFSQ